MHTSPLDQIATGESNYEKYKDLFNDDRNDVVTMDSFYKLLVAEMSNQDPLEPTSNTEFISQLASFTSLQAQQENFALQKQNYANSLIGQVVTVQGKTKEDLVTGVVESVSYGDEITIKVNDKTYKLSSIKQVHGSAYQPGTTISGSSQIGDYGAFAAGILGKTVMVQAQDRNGETVLDRGVVSSIEIENGMVRVVVNDYAYDVTDIVQVTESVNPNAPKDTDDDEDEETAAGAPSTEAKAPEKTEQTPTEPADAKKTEATDKTETTDKTEPTETNPTDTNGTLTDRTDEKDLTDLVENEQTEQAASWVQESEVPWTEPISDAEKEDLRGLFGVE